MKIQLVLPPRIGDTILCLPALYTFANLIKTQAHNFQVQLLCSKVMLPILTKLNIFPVTQLNLSAKINSWFQRPEQTFFFNNSTDIIGLFSQHSFGERLDKRFYNNYKTDIQSLSIDKVANLLPKELFDNLDGLSLASKRYFGFLLTHFSSLASGQTCFSITEILTAYNASKDCPVLSLGKSVQAPNKKYFTLCLEAANNKAKNKNRAWPKELFLKAALAIYQMYNLEVVLLGTSTEPIEAASHIHDYRGKFSLEEVGSLIQGSEFYLGNDSGLLHLANLLGKKTIGIYTITNVQSYGPIRGALNVALQSPSNEETVLEAVRAIIEVAK
jgi:hypothetical protein